MSRKGLEVAWTYGLELPAFKNNIEAKNALFARRDELVSRLLSAASRLDVTGLDMTPESLKVLEGWYFDLVEKDAFDSTKLNRPSFESAISMYVGEVIVRNNPAFSWLVESYFMAQGKYEIGVGKPLLKIMLTRGSDLTVRRDNVRRQSLWRDYKRYFLRKSPKSRRAK